MAKSCWICIDVLHQLTKKSTEKSDFLEDGILLLLGLTFDQESYSNFFILLEIRKFDVRKTVAVFMYESDLLSEKFAASVFIYISDLMSDNVLLEYYLQI